jgi:hypothetical protein
LPAPLQPASILHFDESIITGTRNVGLGSDEVEEPHHRRLRVEHRLVHVDVEICAPLATLLAGRFDGAR